MPITIFSVEPSNLPPKPGGQSSTENQEGRTRGGRPKEGRLKFEPSTGDNEINEFNEISPPVISLNSYPSLDLGRRRIPIKAGRRGLSSGRGWRGFIRNYKRGYRHENNTRGGQGRCDPWAPGSLLGNHYFGFGKYFCIKSSRSNCFVSSPGVGSVDLLTNLWA